MECVGVGEAVAWVVSVAGAGKVDGCGADGRVAAVVWDASEFAPAAADGGSFAVLVGDVEALAAAGFEEVDVAAEDDAGDFFGWCEGDGVGVDWPEGHRALRVAEGGVSVGEDDGLLAAHAFGESHGMVVGGAGIRHRAHRLDGAEEWGCPFVSALVRCTSPP